MWYDVASTAIDASSTMSDTMISVSVRCAFLTVGSRNALTPLLTASTPVIAADPLAKVRSRIQIPTDSVAVGTFGGAITGAG